MKGGEQKKSNLYIANRFFKMNSNYAEALVVA
jgi:hypothetical protein